MAKKKGNLENEILDYIKKNPNSSSREIYDGLENLVAFATIKRTIAVLLDKNFVNTTGRGKSTRYIISKGLAILFPIDIDIYFEKEIIFGNHLHLMSTKQMILRPSSSLWTTRQNLLVMIRRML